MALKQLKPVTASCRNTILVSLQNKSNQPVKTRTKGFRKFRSGRNHSGKITTFHRGNGHKRLYRKLNFYSFNGPCIIQNFEYDPVRNSLLARVFSKNKKKHFYIIATQNMKIGQIVKPESEQELKLGNRCLLKNIPMGSIIHSIGSKARPQRAVFQRAAGTFAQIIQKSDISCTIKLSSGAIKELLLDTTATIGSVSNAECRYKNLGKAGRKRWIGIRPTVRGVAMNPVDHPHGGGEGKSSGGRPSVTPWSRPAHGRKTK